MHTRSKKAGRPQAASSDAHQSQSSPPTKSLMSLKKTDPKTFVNQTIRFLRTQKCHPDVGVGWWCCFPTYMSQLLTFLADSDGHDRRSWKRFRKEVAVQLRNCRQCVVKYHESVSQWELREQDNCPADVVKGRVQSLLDWDCERVLPLITSGADLREDDPEHHVLKLQCREAFFEALVSLRLCTSSKFCESLGKLFQKRIPARNEEDTLPFIRQLGFVPEGLIALCFHNSPVVQIWALRIYKASQKGLRVPREPLFFVLRRAVKNLSTLQDQICFELYLDKGMLERDFARLDAQWEGVSSLICTMKEDAIQSFVRRNRNLLLVKNACTAITLNSERTATSSLKVLRVFLRSLSFDCMFDQKPMSPVFLLDSIFLALRKHLNKSTTTEKILSLIGCVLGFVHRSCAANSTSQLFKKCLTELYGIAEDANICGFEVRLEGHGSSSAAQQNPRARKSLLKTAAEVLRYSYTNSSPSLPVDDIVMISNIVTAALNLDPMGNWSWDLFKCVLLTDVFNILRSLKNGEDLRVIARTFLGMRPVGEKRPEEEAFVADVVSVRDDTEIQPTWVGPLWRRVVIGEHLKKTDARNEGVIDREISVLLDLHRLMGVFDARKVKFVLDEQSSGSTSPQPRVEQWNLRTIRRLVELITSVQETISARFRWACSELPGKSWSRHLPFHAAHLVSSARKDIAKLCLAALKTSYGLKDAVSVIPQSKLLVQLMKQDERTADMMMKGFTSSIRTIVVLSNMASIRTYAVFFQWYRTLLDSEYTVLLHDESTSNWMLAVVRAFSDNWSGFEATISEEEFREACCQFFKQLREVWTRLHDEVQSKNEAGKHQGPSLIRAVIQSLFKMHTLKDTTVLASWVHTMSSMAEKWNKSREHRAAMSKIIATHANGTISGSRLSHNQCSKLAQAGNLDDVQPVLLAWSRRKETINANRNARTKTYEGTKIDQFFERKRSTNSSVHDMPGLPLQNVRNKSATADGVISMRNRLPLMRTLVKPIKSTGHVSELRRELVNDLGRSKRTKKVRSELQQGGRPKKTYFELERERYIAEKALSAGTNQLAKSSLDSENHFSGGLPVRESQKDEQELSSLDTELDLEAQDLLRCTVPSDIRSTKKRDMDVIYCQLLSSSEPSLVSGSASGRDNKAFSNTEEYVDFWEPLLIAECRTSLRNMIGEENMFAARFKHDPYGYRYCRSVFEVQEPPSSVGHFHQLSMQLCETQRGELKGLNGDFSSSQFSIFDAQPTDVVYLLIPPARRAPNESGPMTEAIALVSATKVNKGVLQLELRICFEDGLETAPGKGRRIQVSRLMSLTTFQRRIEALWLVTSLPDGLLWPILDPSKGYAVNDVVESRHEEASLALTNFSRNFVSELKSSGSLNESQAGAITSVLRSAGPLFEYHGPICNRKFFKKNHGALTLIQGPPGTGKTSTIINLLSTLVLTSPRRKHPRMTRILIDDQPFRIKMPAIRVLVCAPSNAAVDEVMLRVMEQGLPAPGGGRACPRMVRVGHGTTQERLKGMELTMVAKCENHTAETAQLGDAQSRLTDHCRVLREVNDRISKMAKERRELIALDEKRRKESQVGTSSELTSQIQSFTEKLSLLYDEKDALKRYLSRDRDEVKEKNQARKREKMKRMCTTLNQSTVVFSTLNSSGHELMRTLGTAFDVIIIDEAAQCIEPESLIPMTIGLRGRTSSRYTEVVMVGDPKQLPATILSTNPRVLRPMGMSLFERVCLNDPGRVMMLRVQYRMNPMISSFPNKQFYSGLLQDGTNVQGDAAFRSFHNDRRKRFGPLTFFDTANVGTEERRTAKGSISNIGEARMVITILKSLVRLYKLENLKNDIVILSPYSHQVNILKQLVRECVILESMSVEVSTIDGIQGREKSFVILSTVRGKNANDIGFVKDERRMNVALTRAKHSLLIVGDAPVLSRSSSAWYELIKHCKDQDCLVFLPKRAEALFPDRSTADDLSATSKPNQSGGQPALRSKLVSMVQPISVHEELVQERNPEGVSFARPCHSNLGSKSPSESVPVQRRPVLRSVKRPSSCDKACEEVNEMKRMKQEANSVKPGATDSAQKGFMNAAVEEGTGSTTSGVDGNSKLSNGEKRPAKSGELEPNTSKAMKESSLPSSSNISRVSSGSKPLHNLPEGNRKVQDPHPIGLPSSKRTIQTIPLRSHVLLSAHELKTKNSEARSVRSLKTMREKDASSQRVTSGSSFGPFAPSRRKGETSPFESKNVTPFVYSHEMKTENSKNKKPNNALKSGEVRPIERKSPHQLRQPLSHEKQIRSNDEKSSLPARTKHQTHPQQPLRYASETRANVFSRLGTISPGIARNGYSQLPSASKLGASVFKRSSHQRGQHTRTQSIHQSVGTGSRSRPLSRFPSVAPGVQKPTSQNNFGSRQWGTEGRVVQAKKTPFVKTRSDNHRGFVKKQARELRLGCADAGRYDGIATNRSEAKSQAETRRANSQRVSHNRPQSGMTVASKGPFLNATQPRLPGIQGRRERGGQRQSPAGSLLQRLQAGQEKTLNMLKRA